MCVSRHYQCIFMTQVILLWNKVICFPVKLKLRKTCMKHAWNDPVYMYSFLLLVPVNPLAVCLDCVLAKENLSKIFRKVIQNNVKSLINLFRKRCVTKLFDWFLTLGSKYNIFLFCIQLICISIFVFICSLIMCTFYKAWFDFIKLNVR